MIMIMFLFVSLAENSFWITARRIGFLFFGLNGLGSGWILAYLCKLRPNSATANPNNNLAGHNNDLWLDYDAHQLLNDSSNYKEALGIVD